MCVCVCMCVCACMCVCVCVWLWCRECFDPMTPDRRFREKFIRDRIEGADRRTTVLPRGAFPCVLC